MKDYELKLNDSQLKQLESLVSEIPYKYALGIVQIISQNIKEVDANTDNKVQPHKK